MRVHLYLSGTVQGVFFRDFTRRQAKALKIKGWVRNLIDGRVEAVGEGEEKEINEWLKKLREGPPGARVTNIEIYYEEPTGEFSDFSIIY
ncbi:MAG: acylphosphatase [candidate division WOR-3 bacterium]